MSLPTAPPKNFNPKKILAIKLRALGDTVLMTAPLAALRKRYPNAEIHALVLAPWASVLESHPAVDKIWTYERHAEVTAKAKAVARIALRLRHEGFDAVANFHASTSSATIAFATGAPVRAIHFHGHQAKNRYSTVEIPGKGTLKPIIERDMDVVRALGVDAGPGRLPEIKLRPQEFVQGEDLLASLKLPEPILGLGLGASRPTKSWPIEKFVETALAWTQETGGSCLALCGPSEQVLAHRFAALVAEKLAALPIPAADRLALGERIVVRSDLAVRTVASLLRSIAVFLANDSGLRHVAVALGTPTVTLFGPEHPFEWHPYSADGHPYHFIDKLVCRKDADPGMPEWCGLYECVREQHRCMTGIAVGEVLASCRKVAGL